MEMAAVKSQRSDELTRARVLFSFELGHAHAARRSLGFGLPAALLSPPASRRFHFRFVCRSSPTRHPRTCWCLDFAPQDIK